MGKFIFTQTEIPGVVVIEPQVFGDDRGYFMETYQKDQFAEAGIDKEFVQDNQSRSTRGVLRGLHFQKEHTRQVTYTPCNSDKTFILNSTGLCTNTHTRISVLCIRKKRHK